MRYVRITKKEAKKRFAASEPVYLCPCKMYPAGPWSVASLVFGQEYIERTNSAQEAWEKMYNNWSFYNASHETGYYPHYYVTIDE